MHSGFRLGRISGIDIHLDWSLLIIFSLITVALGTGVFPAWHPNWGGGQVWGTAVMAAVLFLGSVLLHEMAHAVVGRRLGAKIPRITLFVFGGMAQMEREPETWKGEFWMAIVGPITSLAIGFVCLYIGGALAGIDAAQLENPQQMLNQLGPAATLLFWLGPVNIILGLFNLVPGFPLDGGRVFRAAIWGATGDLHKATRWAAGAGKAFGWLLIASGFAMILGIQVPIFGSGFVGGLWLALIGWFLNNAAVMSYQQLVVQQSLDKTPVSEVMQTELTRIPPDISLATLVDEYLLHSSQRIFAVTRGGDFLGLVCLEDLRGVKPGEREHMKVADIMTPKDRLTTVKSSDDAASATDTLNQKNVNQLPVMENDRLVGLLTRESVLRWLSLQDRTNDVEARG